MKVELNENKGYIILDDNTGKIMSVFVKNAVKGKFDALGITSYKIEGNKHYNIRK